MKPFTFLSAILLCLSFFAENIQAQTFSNGVTPDPVWGSSYWRYSDSGDDVVTTETELKAAITAASTYSADKPYIIPVAGNITLTGVINITASRNIVLRKVTVSDAAEPGNLYSYQNTAGKYINPKYWNFDNPWINTNAATPDFYDGEPDFFITVNGNFRHFHITSSPTSITTENITLKGRNEGLTYFYTYNYATDVISMDAALPGGGILYDTDKAVTLACNIAHTDAGNGGAIGNNHGKGSIPSALTIRGGIISHARSQSVGGAIHYGYNSGTAAKTFTISGHTIIENNFNHGEGGGMYLYANNCTLNVIDNVIFRNNTGGDGGAIHTQGAVSLNLRDNVKILNNSTLVSKKVATLYPGNGGGIYISNFSVTGDVPSGYACAVYDNVIIEGNRASRGGGAIAEGNASNYKAQKILLQGGIIRNNTALGTARELTAGWNIKDAYAIGGGGGIYSYTQTNIIIPDNSTVFFGGNSAAYAAYMDNGELQSGTTGNTFFDGDTYVSHIQKSDIHTSLINQSGEPGRDYYNLYNNYDIGIPNSLIKNLYPLINTGVIPSDGAGGRIDRDVSNPIYDILGDGRQWAEMGFTQVYSAFPMAGYEFVKWEVSSSVNPLQSEMATLLGCANTPEAIAAMLENSQISLNVLDFGIDLTATFKKSASLVITPPVFPVLVLGENESITDGTVVWPDALAFSVNNDGESDVSVTGVSLVAGDADKFTLIGTSGNIVAGATDNITWKIQPKQNAIPDLNLGDPPQIFTVTVQFTYNSGKTADVEVSFRVAKTPIILITGNYGFGTVVCGQDGIDRTITLHNYGVVNGRLNTLFIAKDSFDPDSYVSGEDITPYLDDSGVFQAGKSPDWDVSVDAGPDAVVDGSDNTSWSVHVSSDADPGVYSRQLVAIYSSAGAPSTLYATAVPLTVTLVSPASLSVSPAILTDGHIAFPADREGYALSSVIDIILENEGQTAAVIRSASVQSDTCFSLINHNYTDYVPAISGSVKGSNNSYAVAPKTELQAGVYRDTVVFIFGDGTGTDRTLKVGVEFKIVPAWHTWAGGNKINPGDSDHAWSVPGNWIPAGLPDDIQFIRFDASAIDLHVDGNYTAPNITNTTPANLVIRKNAALTLTRVVNAKSTALDFTGGGKIHVASGDTTGVNGALTVPKGSSANVSFTFYTYATGPDNAETAGEMSWQYFGIPVKEYQAISMEGGFIREYDETRTTGYWKFLENSDVLKAATGYEISRKRYQGGFFTFAGALNTNDMTLTGLTLTSGAAYPGQHLASNPYAAGLSIKNGLEFGDNMEDAVYLFHTGSRSDWENNQAEVSGHAAGQYLAVPRVQAGSGGLPDTLASMQGFVVRVDAGKTPDPAKNSLTFKYESLTKGNAQLRSASAATPKVSTVVTLSETGGGVKDRIWLFSDRNATFGYDNGYDGYKIFGESTLAGLYVKHGERNYQVSTQPTVDSTWLFLKAASNVTDYTLTFRHDNLEARYGSLYLYDAVTNTTVEITDDSAAYRFTAGNVLTGDRRFLLTAAGAATSIDGADVPAPCLSMYGNNGITVENGCSLPVHVQVYSLQGRLLHVADVAGQSRETLSGRFIPGMYIVRAIAGTEIRTEKIVITDKY